MLAAPSDRVVTLPVHDPPGLSDAAVAAAPACHRLLGDKIVLVTGRTSCR
jgi:hypothetical protein